MDGDLIFKILTGLMITLFGVVLLIVYLYDRRFKATGWFSVVYFTGLAAFLLYVNRGCYPFVIELAANTFFWGTSGAITAAGCARAGVKFPVRSFVALALAGYGSLIYFGFISPDLYWRYTFGDAVGGLMIALCLPACFRNQRRSIDRALNLCFAILALSHALRPALSYGFIYAGDVSDAGILSGYSLLLYSTGASAGLALGVIALLAAGLDIMEQLQRDSVTDFLTGLNNQRGLANIVDEEVKNAGEAGLVDRAVLMMDIDHFKRINDQFGHEVGDNVLAAIGKTMHELMQYHGVAARSGGEEFTFLFNPQSSSAAFLVSEHFRISMGLLCHPELPEGEKVTVSIGLAFIRKGEAFKRALRRADAALYVAKDNGRNRLKIAEGDLPPKTAEFDGITPGGPPRRDGI